KDLCLLNAAINAETGTTTYARVATALSRRVHNPSLPTDPRAACALAYPYFGMGRIEDAASALVLCAALPPRNDAGVSGDLVALQVRAQDLEEHLAQGKQGRLHVEIKVPKNVTWIRVESIDDESKTIDLLADDVGAAEADAIHVWLSSGKWTIHARFRDRLEARGEVAASNVNASTTPVEVDVASFPADSIPVHAESEPPDAGTSSSWALATQVGVEGNPFWDHPGLDGMARADFRWTVSPGVFLAPSLGFRAVGGGGGRAAGFVGAGGGIRPSNRFALSLIGGLSLWGAEGQSWPSARGVFTLEIPRLFLEDRTEVGLWIGASLERLFQDPAPFEQTIVAGSAGISGSWAL
ncbi:MAG TPA: hypothetical protein VK762_10260, partial [Polyangiaceae bacterium]|nr:hypothetical protein [Polyangiaceae bacterium]